MSILVAASIGLAVLAVALIVVACRAIGAMNRLTDAIGKLNLEATDKGKGGVKFMGPTSLQLPSSETRSTASAATRTGECIDG